MKTLLLALALVTSSAFAAEKSVFEINAARTSGKSSILPSYGINLSLGRAWVEIEVQSSMSDTDSDYYRTQVEGLSIKNNQVVLAADGLEVACANIVKVGIIGNNHVARSNGNCKFEIRTSTVTADDGYETSQKKVYTVVLVTK